MATRSNASVPLKKSSKTKLNNTKTAKTKKSPPGKEMAAKPGKKVTVAALGKKLARTDRRLGKLESTLDDFQKKFDELRGIIGVLERKLGVLESDLKKSDYIVNHILFWGELIDQQLQELDDGHRNLWVVQEANDPGPHQRPSLKSCLGLLADQGSAIPIDGNAAAILRAKIKYQAAD